MLKHLLRLYRDDQAATAVEYAVMLALVLMAVISTISALGDSTHGLWANDTTTIETAIGS